MIEVTTIQETSKRLKAQILLAWVLIMVGMFSLFITTVKTEFLPISFIAIAAGVAWEITTRIRIWWHHK